MRLVHPGRGEDVGRGGEAATTQIAVGMSTASASAPATSAPTALRALAAQAPTSARLERGGTSVDVPIEQVPIEQVRAGDNGDTRVRALLAEVVSPIRPLSYPSEVGRARPIKHLT